MKFYVVTVKRVLDETFMIKIEADTMTEAKADAVEVALSEPPSHRLKTHMKTLKVKRT